MIFLFHHTLQKKRKWGWEWRKRDSGEGQRGWEWGGTGWGGRTRKQNKTSRKSISLPLGWWRGRDAWGGRGPGSSVQRGCPQPTHTHPRYVQYKPQIITTAKEKRKEDPGVGSEVGKARRGHRDKISHIYNLYISINLAPAGCMCVGGWD